MMRRFERYVAIGDSTTEGLDDPDGRGGYRGWANRIAQYIADEQGSVLYANLAVRGRTTRQIREQQLDRAVAMRPDVATVVSGTNDLLRRRFDVDVLGNDIEAMQRALVGVGATVLTFTLPDMSDVMPIARLFRERLLRMNQRLRDVSARTGTIVCDLAAYPVAADPRVWSADRLHANSAGHARIAEALLDHLGYTSVGKGWAQPLPDAPPHSALDFVHAEWAWARGHLLPWLWRHARGRSSGDGITPKFPELVLVEGRGAMLKAMGYWCAEESRKLPDPRDLVDHEWQADNRERIAMYLQNAPRVIPWLGYSFCRFDCGVPDESMGDSDMSDGVYVWPQGLAHYVRVHHVRLPDEFVQHISARGFQPPERAEPPSSIEIMNEGMRWWRTWADEQR